MTDNAVVRFVSPSGQQFTMVVDPKAYHANLPGLAPGWTFQVSQIVVADPGPKDTESLVQPDEAMRMAQDALRHASNIAEDAGDRADRETAIMWTGIAEVWAKIAEVRHMTTPLMAEGPSGTEDFIIDEDPCRCGRAGGAPHLNH